MQKPLIGVTAVAREYRNGLRYEMAYQQNFIGLEAAGALPVIIPSEISQDTLHALYRRLDGVLLPGGGDVDPKFYNAERHPLTNSINLTRDATELALARWAARDDLPLFGICRGIQVMNVALGGTLIQDIPSEVGDQYTHDIPNELPRSTICHEVMIQPSSHLASILGATRVAVNSLHHQSIGDLAPDAVVTAVSPDEVIEAFEFPNKSFVLGVQWHPEDMLDNDKMQALFNHFVDICRGCA